MTRTEIIEISATPPSICDSCFISPLNPTESLCCQLCPFVLVDIKGHCSICNKPFVYKGIPRGSVDEYVYCSEHKKAYDEFKMKISVENSSDT